LSPSPEEPFAFHRNLADHLLAGEALATTAAEATTMAAACEAAGVVLCEAYMTPYHPRSALADEVR
jgi:hypothetical protein